MLNVRNLTVKYHTSQGDLPVLDRTNLSVKKGEKLGIIGESGSGKTSLALALTGLSDGYIQGSVTFNEEELLLKSREDWEQLRGSTISIVMQQAGEMLTPVIPLIKQVMETFLKLFPHQHEEALRRAAYMLQRVGLKEDLFYRYPYTLSGGEVQRALLAMALINEPELLILDEPVSSLDALTKADILELLEEVTIDCTMIVISHDLHTVGRLADRTAVLYCGSLLETAPTAQILQTPQHPYTRALVRSYPSIYGLKELQGIRGDFPSLGERPGGCPFHTRCTQALEVCSREHPRPVEKSPGWFLSCHRGGVIELLRGTQISQRYMLEKKKEQERYLEAVRDIDIFLLEGEVFALVGESGSGKSTLGRILAGVDTPYKGKVYFQGKELQNLSREEKKAARRGLQMLFQNSGEALSHRMTVLDLVSEPLLIQEIGDQQSKHEAVRRCLQWVHLPGDEHFLNEYPHHLSGGELQRVALARALVLEPRVLIADEPSASLDASVQAKVIKLLLKLQNERGFALFLITHDLAMAARASDRMGVMHNGVIVEEGPASNILRNPLHPYTQSLVGAAPSLNEALSPAKKPPRRKAAPVSPNGKSACSYSSNCAHSCTECFHYIPPVVDVGFQKVSCHLYNA